MKVVAPPLQGIVASQFTAEVASSPPPAFLRPEAEKAAQQGGCLHTSGRGIRETATGSRGPACSQDSSGSGVGPVLSPLPLKVPFLTGPPLPSLIGNSARRIQLLLGPCD